MKPCCMTVADLPNAREKLVWMCGWMFFRKCSHLPDVCGSHGGGEALKFDGRQRLNAEYAEQFGIEAQIGSANMLKH